MTKLRIGSLKLSGNVLLAPMAKVTTLPFRLLCKKYGAALAYSEVTDAVGVIYQNGKSCNRIMSCSEEKPFAVQLSGASPDNFAMAARIVEEQCAPQLIDINLGCPARRLTRHGCGAALLTRPQLIAEVIRKTADAVSVPVTAKIRIHESLGQTLKVASVIEENGASALTVHGRTPAQRYAGFADLDVIRAVKEDLSIPVIANGDITDEASARHMLEHTGCDGLMIGRAAIGNPHVFKRITHYLDTGEYLMPQSADAQLQLQLHDFFEYVELSRKHGVLDYADVKLHSKWFTRGFNNAGRLRNRINSASNINGVLKIINELAN